MVQGTVFTPQREKRQHKTKPDVLLDKTITKPEQNRWNDPRIWDKSCFPVPTDPAQLNH